MPGKSNESREVLKQTQRVLVWNAYQESLNEVDRKVLEQFQTTIKSLRIALWIRTGTYFIQLLLIAIILFWSLQHATQISQDDKWWIWGIAIGSLVMLAVLIFRNPLPSINHILVDLARIQILLQGHIRQINQVDAVFKQAILNDKIDFTNIGKSLKQIQIIIDNNIESLLQFLEEMHM